MASGRRWGGWTVGVAAIAAAMAASSAAAVGGRAAWHAEASREAQEAVVLRPAFGVGQTVRYDLEAVFDVTGSMAGSDAERRERLEQAARVRATVTGVDRAGVATIRLAFDALRAERTAAGPDGDPETQSFAWPPAEGEEAGGGSPMAAMHQVLAEKGLELEVLPDGTIRKVSGMDAVYAAGDGLEEPLRSRALGLFAPGAVMNNLSAIWRVDPGERRTTRRPGDAWAAVQRSPLGQLGTIVMTTRFTLDRVADGVAEITGRPTVALEAGEGLPDPALPAPELTKHEGAERVRWETAGRLLERERTGATAWTVRLATSEPMVANAATSERITIRLSEEPSPAEAPGG